MYGNINTNAKRPGEENDEDYGENIEDNIDKIQVGSKRPRSDN